MMLKIGIILIATFLVVACSKKGRAIVYYSYYNGNGLYKECISNKYFLGQTNNEYRYRKIEVLTRRIKIYESDCKVETIKKIICELEIFTVGIVNAYTARIKKYLKNLIMTYTVKLYLLKFGK